MQSERMFFIWTLPHTSGPVDLLSPSPPSPLIHNVIVSNYFLTFGTKEEEEKKVRCTFPQH